MGALYGVSVYGRLIDCTLYPVPLSLCIPYPVPLYTLYPVHLCTLLCTGSSYYSDPSSVLYAIVSLSVYLTLYYILLNHLLLSSLITICPYT